MTNNRQATSDIRRRDLQRFIDARKIKVAPWAREAGISEGTVRNFLTKRSATLTQATVDALAAALGVTTATIFPSVEGRGPAKGRKPKLAFMADGGGARDLPVVVSAGSAGRLRLNHRKAAFMTERPEYLRKIKAAYALQFHDAAMSPAFERGWLVYVNPTHTAKAGDNVVVTFADGSSTVRRLVRKSKAGVTLRQFNPRKDSESKTASVSSLHVIAGVRYQK